jgi:antitoxin component YwqK of YwqJK toxin-antitoxin module
MSLLLLPYDLRGYLVEDFITEVKTFLALRLTCKKLLVLCSLDKYKKKFVKLVKYDNPTYFGSYFTLSNGLRHGACEERYHDGQLRRSSNFDCGTAEVKIWHQNGQLMQQCRVENEDFEGEFKMWFENGQQQVQSFYIRGKIEGEYKSWYKDGTIGTHVLSENGKVINVTTVRV